MKLRIAILLSLLMLQALPAHAVTIQEVTSKHGLKAWLVEDHKLPLIAFHFAFRGGLEQDPADKQGLAHMSMELLTQGAGPYDAAAFQQELADHSIQMNFNAGRDVLSGNIKMLRDDRAKAFELLQLALTQPHFDAPDIERQRGKQLAGLRVQLGDPGWQARYALFQKIFGTHPYGQRRLGSTQTLAGLTRVDIQTFFTDHLAQDNLLVAVAGDITPAELAEVLDHIFGGLPAKAKPAAVGNVVWPENAPVIQLPREGTQTHLLFAMPGPKRDDPDWYAVEIANYILGGGGFSSRLMQEVRDKNGLTYGISTNLSSMEYGGVIVGEAAVDNAKAGKAWPLVSQTLREFYDAKSIPEKELNAAKDYLSGSMPLALTSTNKIASALIDMQVSRLGRDYLDRYNGLIRKVTPEDIARAIRRWFNPERLSLVMVGKPEGVQQPLETKELTRE